MQKDFLDIDRFDQSILTILAEDGRVSVADLARRIGLSKSPTQARLKRLEAEGIITGYRALLDPIRVGISPVGHLKLYTSGLQAFDQAVTLENGSDFGGNSYYHGDPRPVCAEQEEASVDEFGIQN